MLILFLTEDEDEAVRLPCLRQDLEGTSAAQCKRRHCVGSVLINLYIETFYNDNRHISGPYWSVFNMTEVVAQPALQQVTTPLSLIPVVLKEAALDSPTFRATAVHFSDQVEIIEKWLDAYVKSISKLVHDVSSLEETFNAFLLRSVPPANVSEAVLDHDYTLLAMKRFGEGSREWWSQVLFGMKKMDTNVVEPIKSFMAGE